MRSHPFVLVDVFTNAPLAGNPLAVFPDADDLDAAEYAGLAREFNDRRLRRHRTVARKRATPRLFRFRFASTSCLWRCQVPDDGMSELVRSRTIAGYRSA
jgi:phenazine biosynthesis-like protein